MLLTLEEETGDKRKNINMGMNSENAIPCDTPVCKASWVSIRAGAGGCGRGRIYRSEGGLIGRRFF